MVTVSIFLFSQIVSEDLQGLPIRPNHLLRMLPRSLGQLRPRQHARHFFSALFACNLADRGLRPSSSFALFDHVVMIGKGCDLRQVGDAEHLIAFGERLQFLPHSLGRAPSDAGINLVKY